MKEKTIDETYIEGLLRILCCRDAETAEHTRRVTTMTLRFACLWDLPRDQLVHLSHGAQLHDIAKVGIPDAILHKNGPLTDEERAVMKMHPVYAYQLLHPISYLRPALDIPYCHHEKWDGTGYPRGLKGSQIPFAARLFALVDVWDALLSDRPYRGPWTRDQTIAYIRDQSGKHFDPAIVSGFDELVGSIDEFNGINPFFSLDPLLSAKQDSTMNLSCSSDD